MSDLLPAGAGAKSAEFVASGTLGSGVTVALQSDGTVEAVASASTPAAKGSSVAFNSVDSNDMAITYSSANQKVIITYRDQDNNSYGTAVVGTVSGTSISFGSPVVYNSANSIDGAPVSDENTGKIVIFYRDQGNSERGTAKVGTISGTSISFGSAVVFNSGGASNYNSPVYDPDTQKVVNFYKDEPNSNYATAIVGTVSGTSISFGSEVVWQSGEAEFISATYDTNANKMVVAYRDNSNSLYGTAIVGTVSGTSISFGSKTVYNTGDSRYNAIAYDANSGSVVVVYQDFANSSHGTAVVGTVSGTSISFGSEVVFSTSNPTDHIDVVYFALGQNVVVCYEVQDDSFYKVGTVSGDSIAFGSQVSLVAAPAAQSIRDGVLAYDSDQSKIVFSYQQSSTSGNGVVFNPAYSVTNSADFIGITDQAIANAAIGAVIVQGGVITNSNLIESNVTVGSESVFDTDSAAFIQVAYDSGNNKIVIAYADGGNSNYGTAIVGTVSGSSVTFGSAVVFNSAAVGANSIVYDVNAGKVVISYQDGGASNRGRSVVGTVSGTSISFGSEAQFSGSSSVSTALSSSYDANAQKVVIVYQDGGNSDYGTAVVGTISGTDITFGSSAVYLTAGPALMDIAYDTGAQKHLIVFQDGGNSNYTTGIVGTVSGTSISFGSKVAINNYNGTSISIAYDSTAAKTVVVYRSIESSPYQPEAVVATISGTSVSFGTKTKDTNFASGVGGLSIAYNPTIDKTLLIVRDEATGTKLGYVLATVSGTGISFGTSAFANADSTSVAGPRNIAYDSSGQKLIACVTNNTDTAGDSYVFSSVTGLTPNSTYYVQDDGTLSTTVSSVPAGRALSSTSILLEG